MNETEKILDYLNSRITDWKLLKKTFDKWPDDQPKPNCRAVIEELILTREFIEKINEENLTNE